jgi:hypothetical protein
MGKSKATEMVNEMKNEAMILDYLSRAGYEHSPRLIYSGPFGVCYVNVTQLIKGK